ITARRDFDAAHSSDVGVVLMQFEHPEDGSVLRVSSDPTERLSVDPLLYGTRSTWLGANPVTEPFLFLTLGVEWPGDQEEAGFEARLILSNFDSQTVQTLRSFTRPAVADLAHVMASTPDLVEVEARDLMLVASDIDADRIELTLSRRVIEDEAFPSHRMTKQRVPGLFA
uniref:hypothetical protein n=1 Tax=Pelagimonas sp. TaxID=2073170 RepID=UPI003D6BBD61